LIILIEFASSVESWCVLDHGVGVVTWKSANKLDCVNKLLQTQDPFDTERPQYLLPHHQAMLDF